MAANRLMVFVDGSNVLVELSRTLGTAFRAERLPQPALHLARLLIDEAVLYSGFHQIRRFWFGTFVGSREEYTDARRRLRREGFEPVLFHGSKGREKGVDIALTKEMLVNAFHRNFDFGLLVAGDEDYVGLVNEAKRYGQIIHGTFFTENLSPELRIALDQFSPFDLQHSMAEHVARAKAELAP